VRVERETTKKRWEKEPNLDLSVRTWRGFHSPYGKQSPKRNFHRQPGLFDTQDEIFWHWDLVFGSTHVTEKARVSRVREKIHEVKTTERPGFDLPTPIPRWW
jgi:hypothetical protein